MTRDEEARVIRAVLDGDTARFEDLVHAYEKGIYNLCLRMLGDEQDALDASQDAFFKAYRALGSFRGDSRFSSWLYRLASNVCLDMLRKRPAAPEPSFEEDEFDRLFRDTRPTPQEALEQKELRRTVADALTELPAEFRQAVVLRDVNGLSYDEIGAITGLEQGTVKSRIYRARKKLADVLLASGNFSGYAPSKRSGKGGANA